MRTPRCHRRLELVSSSCSSSQLGTRWQSESQQQTEGFGPSVTHSQVAQPRWERSAAMVRETLAQYVAVCPRLQLTSHTQPTATLSRIKCERYLFYKEVCLFVHWSSSLLLTMFPRIFVYVLWIYNINYKWVWDVIKSASMQGFIF